MLTHGNGGMSIVCSRLLRFDIARFVSYEYGTVDNVEVVDSNKPLYSIRLMSKPYFVCRQ